MCYYYCSFHHQASREPGFFLPSSFCCTCDSIFEFEIRLLLQTKSPRLYMTYFERCNTVGLQFTNIAHVAKLGINLESKTLSKKTGPSRRHIRSRGKPLSCRQVSYIRQSTTARRLLAIQTNENESQHVKPMSANGYILEPFLS
jgi:hypothetical protein